VHQDLVDLNRILTSLHNNKSNKTHFVFKNPTTKKERKKERKGNDFPDDLGGTLNTTQPQRRNKNTTAWKQEHS
jgi:hypothetical protein